MCCTPYQPLGPQPLALPPAPTPQGLGPDRSACALLDAGEGSVGALVRWLGPRCAAERVRPSVPRPAALPPRSPASLWTEDAAATATALLPCRYARPPPPPPFPFAPQLRRLSLVWLSHKHPDHVLGLPGLLAARPAGAAPLLVVGPLVGGGCDVGCVMWDVGCVMWDVGCAHSTRAAPHEPARKPMRTPGAPSAPLPASFSIVTPPSRRWARG
jgi:hypothetical protein